MFPRILLLLLFPLTSGAQVATDGPDSLYAAFSEAYARLDSHAIAERYTEDAVLLNLYDGSAPNSLSGREAIGAYFTAFFRQIAANGQRMELTFRVTDRRAVDDYYLDNGYYRLAYHREGREPIETYGKFSTVVVPSATGYRFRTDATTNAAAEEYRAAKPH